MDHKTDLLSRLRGHELGLRIGIDIAKRKGEEFYPVPVDLLADMLRDNDQCAAIIESETGETFQPRVAPWMQACFGPEISADKVERNHRFLEEALELVQASGCSRDEALQLVAYVYDRPQGDINQEVGGVMVTLAAHCLAHGIDMHEAGETELLRIWGKVEQIRAKQAAKPKHSPLPQ